MKEFKIRANGQERGSFPGASPSEAVDALRERQRQSSPQRNDGRR